jgi:GNAT superfamily N-acetyltransferase
VQIRLAQLADIGGIARVHVDTWRASYRGIIPDAHLDSLSYEQREQRWRDNFAGAGPDVFMYVAADDDNRIVGFASGGPERDGDPTYQGELYALYLLPSYHRRGIGRELTHTVAHHLAKQGRSSMLVWVLAQNPARKFYEVLGGQYLYDKSVTIGGAELIEVAYGWLDLDVLIHEHKITDSDWRGQNGRLSCTDSRSI